MAVDDTYDIAVRCLHHTNSYHVDMDNVLSYTSSFDIELDDVLLPNPRENSVREEPPEPWEDVSCAVFPMAQWGGLGAPPGIPFFLWGGN